MYIHLPIISATAIQSSCNGNSIHLIVICGIFNYTTKVRDCYLDVLLLRCDNIFKVMKEKLCAAIWQTVVVNS